MLNKYYFQYQYGSNKAHHQMLFIMIMIIIVVVVVVVVYSRSWSTWSSTDSLRTTSHTLSTHCLETWRSSATSSNSTSRSWPSTWRHSRKKPQGPSGSRTHQKTRPTGRVSMPTSHRWPMSSPCSGSSPSLPPCCPGRPVGGSGTPSSWRGQSTFSTQLWPFWPSWRGTCTYV